MIYQDEKFDQSKGPSITELVDQESVDILQYMGWEVDQSKDLAQVHSVCYMQLMYIFLVEINKLAESY